MEVHEMPVVWDEICKAKEALATRQEKRSTAQWIDAVVQRVNALRMANGGLPPHSREDIMNVWLIMSLQSEAHWKSVAGRVVSEVQALSAEAAVDGADGSTQH